MTEFYGTGKRTEVSQGNQNEREKIVKYYVVTGGGGFIGSHIVDAMGFVDWKLAAVPQQVIVASRRV